MRTKKDAYEPAPRETPKAMEVAPEALENIRGARVLPVEDNEINRNVAAALLEGAGLIADVAENGREAVETPEARADSFKRGRRQ